MPRNFPVPKFITIEDKLAGLLNFRQLFFLLGAFLLSFLVFNQVGQFAGLIAAIIFFGIAILLTFVYINGKPFVKILPNFFDFLLRGRQFVWRRIEKVYYKEIQIPEAETIEPPLPIIKKRETPILGENLTLEIDYPEVSPETKEIINVSLDKPIAEQLEDFSKISHHHILNPKNPYRFFPYVKFYRSKK